VAAVVRVSVVVRRARAEEVFPLRHAVLRPGRPVTASVYGQDDSALHLGAWDDGLLVGCATVFPDPWPGGPEAPDPEPAAWRLRGMAVEPSRQWTGLGRQVLAAAVAAAWEGGAPLLWANARTAALPFYAAAGWTVAGEEFLAADTGLPHLPIVLRRSGENTAGVARRP
jgi:GNAT superfamily N-acetyltransferase